MTRVRKTREQFQELTGYEAESISGLAQVDNGWSVEVDVVELRRVPDTASPPQRPQLSGARGENVLNAAYLVDAGRTEAFAALVRRLDAEAPGTRIELTGPWAPYSFALPDGEEPA